MCLPFSKCDPVVPHGALPTLLHAIALFALIVLAALANDLRPDTGFTPGAPVEVDPIPFGVHLGTTVHIPGWRPR